MQQECINLACSFKIFTQQQQQKIDIYYCPHISRRSAANILQMTLIGHMGDNICARVCVEYSCIHERNFIYSRRRY